jgi:Mg/Co/Ni transporter MgtE
MNKKRAREILGNRSQEELSEALAELNTKEFLWLESDIEKKQAIHLLLKKGEM